LPHRAGELAGRRVAGRRVPRRRVAGRGVAGRGVAGRSPGSGPRSGKARDRRIAWAGGKGGTGPGTRKTAGSLARETAAVWSRNAPRSLVSGEPGTGTGRAGTRRALGLLERVLAERVLAVLLSRRRAAGERALLRWRVRLVPRLLVPRLLVPRLLVPRRRGAVPRSGRSARGHAWFRPAVAGPAMTLTGETRCTVSAWRAASGSPGESGARLREGRSREPRSGPPARTRSAAALAAVLTRADATLWPGAGVGIRLPAPPP
jgi:hypothetical protein